VPHALEEKAHAVLQQLWQGHKGKAAKVAVLVPAARGRRKAKAKEFPALVPVFEDSDED